MDIRTIAGAANLMVKSAVTEREHITQQGFSQGCNTPKLICRYGAVKYCARSLLVASDNELGAANVGFLDNMNLLHAMHFGPASYIKVNGEHYDTFVIGSGVGQRCPASDMAGVIAMGPIFHRLATLGEFSNGMPKLDIDLQTYPFDALSQVSA
eukprot:5131091-Pyramimonas_sp.AAC.1